MTIAGVARSGSPNQHEPAPCERLGSGSDRGPGRPCGKPQVSNLTYASVSAAAANRGAGGFGTYFKDIQGQRVAWSGRAVEVRTEHGDEFVEVNLLAVDVDGLDGGTTDPDVVFPVSASVADGMIAGTEVTFTGTIENFEWIGGRPAAAPRRQAGPVAGHADVGQGGRHGARRPSAAR